jgi:hypothetical protein
MDETLSTTCEEQRGLMAAAALGDGGLAEETRRHMELCPACAQAYREFVAVARVLPLDAPEVAPPPSLRARVIAAAEAEPAAAPRAAPAPRPAPRRRAVGPWPAFAAAFALVVALLGWNLQLRGQVESQSAQLARSRQGWQDTIVLFNDPELRWYEVRGEPAHGTFWSTPGGTVACLMAQDLPGIAEDQTYQVWLGTGAGAVSGGTFDARNGNGWVIVKADRPVEAFESLTVTVEPAAGSRAPSGPLVLAGTFAAPHAP